VECSNSGKSLQSLAVAASLHTHFLLIIYDAAPRPVVFHFLFFTLQCSLDSLPRLVPAVHGDVSETHRYIKTLCQPSQLDTADP
jgi:hypothetical protein